MSVELIGVGFGRTGTDSTRTALNQLGYPCYHMHEVIGRRHLDFWCEVSDSEPGTQHDWSRVFADFRATIDNPAACVWKELMVAYPDARVLLTHHPGGPEVWYDSTWETIHSPQRMWQWKVLAAFVPFARKMAKVTRHLIFGRFYEDSMGDRPAALRRYQEHSEEVVRTVPPDRLLVFDVKDGWEPLCGFLDVPVPDAPFPRTNDRVSMKRQLTLVARGGYVILAFLAAALIAVAWGLSRFL